jgi:DNA-binding NarL/FixJ family response regulator
LKPIVLILEDRKREKRTPGNRLSSSLPHLNILRARNGEEAVDLARTRTPDIFLLDTGLLRKDGVETARRIKATLPSTHVVLLTNAWNEAFQADAAVVGPSAYVSKRNLSRFLRG